MTNLAAPVPVKDGLRNWRGVLIGQPSRGELLEEVPVVIGGGSANAGAAITVSVATPLISISRRSMGFESSKVATRPQPACTYLDA